ncbi:hypothetical protein K7W42_22110 [Deinococcus sp. HMF7604]|uniref:hypothetical protein n=1 Tax=Deinococcus betulae TaxID=2873312 RepID=UPI001CC9170B|nr:hypothetical protein [Deinococcus betulae]MBZ9753530.1 hypothetical protein [Deinococcus betulae]
MDTKKFMRELKQRADAQIKDQVRELIESQYCPVHGRFASLNQIHGHLSNDATLEFDFDTCCEELQAKVRQGLDGQAQ